MNKSHIKKLKAILRSTELNALALSEIQLSAEGEQGVLEDRPSRYESKLTGYYDGRASLLDERIDSISDEVEALREIEQQFTNLIHCLREKLSDIETDRHTPAGHMPPVSPQNLDPMFDQCARFIVTQTTASTSMLQRRFGIGYNKAGKIMDQMEAAGIVGPDRGAGHRAILVDSITLEEIILQRAR